MRRTKSLQLDLYGAMCSMLCVAHCLFFPVLIGLGYMNKSSWMDSMATELLLVSITFILASYSLINGYLTKHRNLQVVLLAATGVLFFISGLQFGGVCHISMTSLGGILIASSHIWNYRLLH